VTVSIQDCIDEIAGRLLLVAVCLGLPVGLGLMVWGI
jgi:hypothetical protein